MILFLFKNIYKINKISMQSNSEQTNEISLRQPEQDTLDDVSPFDIFNNPQIKRAKESLPPALRQQYEQMGESIWSQMESSKASISQSVGNDVNYTGGNLPPPVEEAAAHIAEALKSGMHPSLLDENEKVVMSECFGAVWWENWGYTKEDMDNGL